MIGGVAAYGLGTLLAWAAMADATPVGVELGRVMAPAQVELLSQALEEDPGVPTLGNPEGDVTVVEFLDYSCAPCWDAQKAVEQLLAEDPELRLVVRAWPSGELRSEAAARAAVAARAQGPAAFRALHQGMLMLPGPADETAAMVLAQVLGLDGPLLQRDMQTPTIGDHLATSERLASALGLAEAPAFVVDDRLLQGAVTAEELRDAVAAAREASSP